MKAILLVSLCALVFLSSCGEKSNSADTKTEDTKDAQTEKAASQQPQTASSQTLPQAFPDSRLVKISTPFGDMKAEIYNNTPQHRDNFIKLVSEGYYDDLLFHRVIQGFMIQGGDPRSKDADANTPLGGGGPGYTIPAEFDPAFYHKKGALSAARQGDQVNPQKASSGSQFYIVQGKPMQAIQVQQMGIQNGVKYTDEQIKTYSTLGGTPFLDQNYTVFGQVIEGLEVIDKIAAQQTRQGDRPVEDISMKISIIK